jgi:hypothetical protein
LLCKNPSIGGGKNGCQCVKIFEQFRKSNDDVHARYPKPFEHLDEDVVNKIRVYNDFVDYLANEYVNEVSGDRLAFSTIITYVHTLFNSFKARFAVNASTETKLFITSTDMDATTEARKRFKLMEMKLKSFMYQRAMKTGESMDHSTTPVYLTEIMAMVGAYASEGSPEAAMRKLAILCGWLAAGRASEVAHLVYAGLEWVPEFRIVTFEVPQSKPSKTKLVPFLAGAVENCDFYVALLDYLALSHKELWYPEDEAKPDAPPSPGAWVFPKLHALKSPGTAMGQFMKALVPGVGAKEYKDFWVRGLRADVSMGATRPGVVNKLSMLMPAEIVAAMTDHELLRIGALFEYIDASLAMCMPGACVLAGHKAPPWGQLCVGPGAADLRWLLSETFKVGEQVLGVTDELLELWTNLLLRIDEARPPQMREGGELRELMLAVVAHGVKYYEDRTLSSG